MSHEPGIRGPMSDLYDVFVDWEGRLGREMPALERHLATVGARRVLDVGCGTGRHVRALRERGFEAHGADASPDMLGQAQELLGSSEGLHRWTAGEPPPDGLAAAAPFDATICVGNVWPSLVAEEQARAAAGAMSALVRPGGLVLVALKAFGVRAQDKNPYLPLLRREHEGRALFFVRFVDFTPPAGDDGVRRCDLHITVLAGEAGADREPEALLHRASRVRAWLPGELGAWFAERGFADVRVTGPLPEPPGPDGSYGPPRGEDVVVHAHVPDRVG